MGQVIVRPIKDIKVYIAFYAWQFSCIGMLPKEPFARIFHLVYIVVGNPVRIVVEARIGQILVFKFIIGVNNGLYMELIFYDMQPCKNVLLELFRADVGWFRLYIQYRSKSPGSKGVIAK